MYYFQGTWADSETEKALKSIVSFAKSYGGNREAIEHAAIHLRLFEALKKEFKVWLIFRVYQVRLFCNVGNNYLNNFD